MEYPPSPEVPEDVEEHEHHHYRIDHGNYNADYYPRDSVEIQRLREGDRESCAHYPGNSQESGKDVPTASAMRTQNNDDAQEDELQNKEYDSLDHTMILSKCNDEGLDDDRQHGRDDEIVAFRPERSDERC